MRDKLSLKNHSLICELVFSIPVFGDKSMDRVKKIFQGLVGGACDS